MRLGVGLGRALAEWCGLALAGPAGGVEFGLEAADLGLLARRWRGGILPRRPVRRRSGPSATRHPGESCQRHFARPRLHRQGVLVQRERELVFVRGSGYSESIPIPNALVTHTLLCEDHPYYDNVDSHVWLVANVSQEMPVAVTYSVAAPISWSLVLRNRVQKDFETMAIGRLHASQAGAEIAEIRQRILKPYRRGGPQAVREHLAEEAESRSANRIHSWAAAFYRSVANKEWY